MSVFDDTMYFWYDIWQIYRFSARDRGRGGCMWKVLIKAGEAYGSSPSSSGNEIAASFPSKDQTACHWAPYSLVGKDNCTLFATEVWSFKTLMSVTVQYQLSTPQSRPFFLEECRTDREEIRAEKARYNEVGKWLFSYRFSQHDRGSLLVLEYWLKLSGSLVGLSPSFALEIRLPMEVWQAHFISALGEGRSRNPSHLQHSVLALMWKCRKQCLKWDLWSGVHCEQYLKFSFHQHKCPYKEISYS